MSQNKTVSGSKKLFSKLFPQSNVISGDAKDADQELMLKVARGDRKAFANLYEKYKGPIMSYVYSMVRNESLSEELTQEVFFKIYRAKDSYVPKAKFSTWAWEIARNTCLDHLRKKGLKATISMEAEGAELTIDQVEADLPTAEEQLLENIDRIKFEECMALLPENQKEALTLRTVSEQSYDEIAGVLKVSLAALKSLIHRAKLSLVECLKSEERV